MARIVILGVILRCIFLIYNWSAAFPNIWNDSPTSAFRQARTLLALPGSDRLYDGKLADTTFRLDDKALTFVYCLLFLIFGAAASFKHLQVIQHIIDVAMILVVYDAARTLLKDDAKARIAATLYAIWPIALFMA